MEIAQENIKMTFYEVKFKAERKDKKGIIEGYLIKRNCDGFERFYIYDGSYDELEIDEYSNDGKVSLKELFIEVIPNTIKKMNYNDSRTIINLVREHFEKQNPQIGFLFFRIESVKKNEDKSKWVIICSLLESFGCNKRIFYNLKVSVKNGIFTEVNKIEENKLKW
jgi:hypothetical protein